MVLNRVAARWFVAKALAHVLALAPLALMVLDTTRQALGADPVAELTHRTGDWALRLLLASLAMTPLRRFTGQAWPIRFRRLLGLYAFCYASLHLAVYVGHDLQGYWPQAFEGIVQRRCLPVGSAGSPRLPPRAPGRIQLPGTVRAAAGPGAAGPALADHHHGLRLRDAP